MEHPYSSCVWEFTLVKELEELKASNHAVGSCCCFGGRREKWHSFFGDPRACQGMTTWRVMRWWNCRMGGLHYLTSEEAEYPWPLCQAYAMAPRQQLDRDG